MKVFSFPKLRDDFVSGYLIQMETTYEHTEKSKTSMNLNPTY